MFVARSQRLRLTLSTYKISVGILVVACDLICLRTWLPRLEVWRELEDFIMETDLCTS